MFLHPEQGCAGAGCVRAADGKALSGFPLPAEALPVFFLIRHVIDCFRFLFGFTSLVLNIGFEYNCRRSHCLFTNLSSMRVWELRVTGMFHANVCKCMQMPRKPLLSVKAVLSSRLGHPGARLPCTGRTAGAYLFLC